MLLAVLLLLAGLQQSPGSAPTPPGQATSGPGGAAYPHASVTRSRVGEGARGSWVFEPDLPRPERAPVVVFLHGLTATNPRTYGAWIDHLVRRGKIVIYPRFQEGLVPRPRTFTANASAAVKEALALLETGGHVHPDPERVAFVGHSAGGIIAANLAARAAADGLPAPGAVFCVEPGSTNEDRIDHISLEDLSRIPAGTLILTLAGDADTICGQADAERIYRESTRVTTEDKDFLLLTSDLHGVPDLRANHLSPLAIDERYDEGVADYGAAEAGRRADALDFYGTWKLLDALCDAAFEGRNREYALGGAPEQRFMGTWSDGQSVSELVVRDLTSPPRDAASTD